MSTILIAEWQDTVKKSFLAEEQKSQLLRMPEAADITQEFVDRFDTMLADAIDAIAATYEKALNELEHAAGPLDAQYREKKKTLDDRLETDLARTDDGKKRDALLDAYYAEVDKLMDWHTKETKKACEQMLRSAI